jgi:hypothetical protein
MLSPKLAGLQVNGKIQLYLLWCDVGACPHESINHKQIAGIAESLKASPCPEAPSGFSAERHQITGGVFTDVLVA